MKKGFKHTEETKKKMSLAKQNMSEETKKKMRKPHKVTEKKSGLPKFMFKTNKGKYLILVRFGPYLTLEETMEQYNKVMEQYNKIMEGVK